MTRPGSARAPKGATGGTCRPSRRPRGARGPQWVRPYELTNVAVANQAALVRTDGTPPALVRDLVAYADAYGPLADELEALAQFLRYSTTAARNLAGTEALTTYALAQRLSKQKRYAHLKPHVADMRRALGRQRKPTPEEVAKTAAEHAVKESAKVPTAAPGPDTAKQ